MLYINIERGRGGSWCFKRCVWVCSCGWNGFLERKYCGFILLFFGKMWYDLRD